MNDILLGVVCALSGAGAVYLWARPQIARLRMLTDRDERGRFVRREPKRRA